MMNYERTELEPESSLTAAMIDGPDECPELLDCCRRTIQMHAKNNPMMVCGECK